MPIASDRGKHMNFKQQHRKTCPKKLNGFLCEPSPEASKSLARDVVGHRDSFLRLQVVLLFVFPNVFVFPTHVAFFFGNLTLLSPSFFLSSKVSPGANLAGDGWVGGRMDGWVGVGGWMDSSVMQAKDAKQALQTGNALQAGDARSDSKLAAAMTYVCGYLA